MYYVIVALVAGFMIFIMFEIGFYNKFQLLSIKINESLNNIDILFEKKFSLLERAINIVRDNDKKYKDISILDNLVKKKSQKTNRFDFNQELTIALREYYSLLDLDRKLSDNTSLKNINEDLVDIDNDLNAAKKYYNDNIVLYNHLIQSLPSNIVAKIFRYKKEDFFKEEKIETLEILKEK